MNEFFKSILVIFLLLLAAITAGAEISIISASRIRLRRLASEGSRRAALVLRMLETPQRFFSTILVSNNVIDTLIAVLVTAVVMRFIGEGGWEVLVSTIVASFLIIVFEVTAKTIAANNSEKLSLLLARPMSIFIKVFAPLVVGFEVIITAVLKIFNINTQSKSPLVTDEEIRALIKLGQEEGSLHKDKYSMISKVYALHDAVVKNVMTPKKDIFAISAGSNIDDILSRVLESGYSRIPVYKDAADNIVGIINMKDLLMLSANKDLVVLQDIMYAPSFVNESKKVTDLLKEFQKGHTHIAVVVDSRNNIQGVVTLEDLVEEIVGEIEDEYDVRVNNYKAEHI